MRTFPSSPSARRRAARLGVVVGVTAFAATGLLFVWVPRQPPPGRADALVVLAGGWGERLDRALALMEAGAAPVLVISLGSQRRADLCGRTTPYVVLCADPSPLTTQGEARMTARLAAEHGWERVLVVTSDYHVRRAALLFGRCLDGVDVVGVSPAGARWHQGRMILREWAALVRYVAFPGC